MPESPFEGGPALDEFLVDLRYGSFVMRQTDLGLKDGYSVPVTRTYRSDNETGDHHDRAFGYHANHAYDVGLFGTSNPFTRMQLALDDGELIMFERISKGTGYADAVYQHSETSTRFLQGDDQLEWARVDGDLCGWVEDGIPGVGQR